MDKRVILASQSPRRKELLGQIVEEFEVEAAEIDERAIEEKVMQEAEVPFFDKARKLVETLAAEKARTILEKHPDALVIGADTVVAHNGRILGKPENAEDAYRMLKSYAGTTHSVLTGFSVQTKEEVVTRSVVTEVTFFKWDEQMDTEFRDYIASGSPMDKAGAYGIQDQAGLWVSEIHGDYLNVVGLPLPYLHRVLHELT